ncbi:hypothetical protein GCM10017608_26210 [Agromyces luteolus]|uniref:Ribbon-helix-helix protein, CopG family n=1 Tax=Agromyces luteolus TaxID=88373 RepID=A0A7C9MJY0_9MICO|nr:hypothetical protein [Agromyces luteolus]MUN08998.1 hypothetical protein [Agromyces luteolus]GLK28686.1 hypothetical protein GCM10017608_26210 [Agromyces luteolus]
MSGLTTVKVDAETHRLIGDLAHLLGRTRGQVVRDAVNAFAVWRERRLDEGAEERDQRLALAGARHVGRLAAGELELSTAERAERSRIGASRISEATFQRLKIAERLELRRTDLETAFGELGARNPRLVDPREHGRDPASTVLLVDLDDPSRFPMGVLLLTALEHLDEIVDVVATNGRRSW